MASTIIGDDVSSNSVAAEINDDRYHQAGAGKVQTHKIPLTWLDRQLSHARARGCDGNAIDTSATNEHLRARQRNGNVYFLFALQDPRYHRGDPWADSS